MVARGRYTQVLLAALAQEAVRHPEPRADFGQARKTWIAVRDQVPLVTIVRTTLRWRKPDSNHRYRVARSRFPEGLISSLLDFLPTEKLARTRTDTTTMPRALRGTDGSNPVPSSGESYKLRSPADGPVFAARENAHCR